MSAPDESFDDRAYSFVSYPWTTPRSWAAICPQTSSRGTGSPTPIGRTTSHTYPVFDLRYGIADAVLAAGYRKSAAEPDDSGSERIKS